jgi:hypothetical protein
MPSWGEILTELQPQPNPATGTLTPPDFDGVRHKYLSQLQALTGRSTIVYATNWLGGGGGDGQAASITLQDMQGLMEAFRDLPGPQLDLILHSPGGSAEAADSLVRYMRSKYDDVRVFVPLAAMSAATMWALAADRICMGKHSQLGPIDPQVTIPSNGNFVLVPASALVRQFKGVSDECAADPSRLSAWLPTLQQYTPGLLEICTNADALARSLVQDWLSSYMLKALPKRQRLQTSRRIADYFAATDIHKTHARSISREDAELRGVRIEKLEDDQALQDAVLSVHHAFMITLQSTPAVKIIENHLGRKVVSQQARMVATQPIPFPVQLPAPPPATP